MSASRNSSRTNRSKKKAAISAQPPTATSGLSSLIGSLFGSATPAYKTLAGRDAKASAPSKGLLSMFAVAPSYKTAHMAAIVEEAPLEIDAVADAGDPGDDDDGAVCMRVTDEIVLL